MRQEEQPSKASSNQSSLGCWIVIVLLVVLFASSQKPSPPPPIPTPAPDIKPSETVAEVHRSFREPFDATEHNVPAIAAQLAQFANWAYDDEGKFVQSARAAGFPTNIQCGVDPTVAYVSMRDDVAVVSFRGTDDWGDWLINLDTSRKPVAGLGAIHAGFDNAYQTVHADIDRQLKVEKISRVWITGHSLGGALSLCCALSHVLDPKLKGIVTFGQPMVVDEKLAKYLNVNLEKKFLHYVNGQDIVPRVPPGFRHCGSLAWFKNGDIVFDSKLFRTFRSTKGSDPDVNDELNDSLPPPLTEQQFRALQETLRAQRNQEVAKSIQDGRVKAINGNVRGNIPFIANHSMQRYLELIRQHVQSP